MIANAQSVRQWEEAQEEIFELRKLLKEISAELEDLKPAKTDVHL